MNGWVFTGDKMGIVFTGYNSTIVFSGVNRGARGKEGIYSVETILSLRVFFRESFCF